MVVALFRTVFAGIDETTVNTQWDHVRTTLAERWPKAADRRISARALGKVWSTNPVERVNKEIKRRSRVVRIFPTKRR